jgi:hypothetical protein
MFRGKHEFSHIANSDIVILRPRVQHRRSEGLF